MIDRVWMRMGDGGDYEEFDGPWDAGDHIGMFYDGRKMPKVRKYGSYGVEVDPGFEGPYNYVSLFWGDKDAQPTKELTAAEIREFRSGLAEGADIKLPVRKAKYSAKPKSGGRRTSGTSGLTAR